MMDKKLNCLAAIPVFGSVILLFWLFIQTIKQEFDIKRFCAYFAGCAFAGFLSMLVSVLFFKFINSLMGQTGFVNDYGLVLAFIMGGYLMNFFTFTLFNKQL